MAERDPAFYAGEGVCPRCGGGWPNCVDWHNATGMPRDLAHEITCMRYEWVDYTCGRCTLEMALRAEL